jgi:nucleotide-binding universal stress UspA family protein
MDFTTLTRILVAVDGSKEAWAACRLAADLAARYAAGLTALYVATPVLRSELDRPRTAIRTESAARAHGQRVLDDARAIAGPQVQISVALAFGDPAAQIRTRARELHVDLVVVGSRELSVIQRLVWGSVSAAVVRHAPCSVLVVRPRTIDRQRATPPVARIPRRTA